MPPAWLVSSMFDADGRVMGEYGTSATNVIAEFIWMNPQVGDGGSFGGDDGVGGYAPLAVASGPVATPTLLWVYGNHLGVPQIYTTSSGALASPGAWQLPGFPGQSRTLADLYYNRHRDYDPSTGRYIQADPIGLDGDINPYVYAGANPVTGVDPLGLSATTTGARWGGIVGAGLGALISRNAGGARLGQRAGTVIGAAIGALCEPDDPCGRNKRDIDETVSDLAKRSREFREDALNLPESRPGTPLPGSGTRSRIGEAEQFYNQQRRLRNLIQAARQIGCPVSPIAIRWAAIRRLHSSYPNIMPRHRR